MIIPAISLWQPWASLVALRAKRFETRSWSTKYRGPLLICASKRFDKQCRELCETEPFKTALYACPVDVLASLGGYALCVVDLFNCWNTTDCVQPPKQLTAFANVPDEREKAFGDWRPGRFAWHLNNVRTFKPFAVTGRQGLFNVDIDPMLLTAPAPLRENQQVPRG